MDLLGPISMKNAAKCEMSLRHAILAMHRVFERNALIVRIFLTCVHFIEYRLF